MEKFLKYTLSADGIFPCDAVCGGVQGEHKATKILVTPDIEVAEKIAEYKSGGFNAELHIDVITASGELIEGEKRQNDELFGPFELTEEMTASGLDIVVLVRIFIIGDDVKEFCRAQIPLYFTPGISASYYKGKQETECDALEEKAEEIIGEVEERAKRIEELINYRLEEVKRSAESTAKHLKDVKALSEEAEKTKLTLEDGIEFSFISGGAEGDFIAYPEGENKFKMRGVFGYREDTYQNWLDKNPVLQSGEPAIVRDARDEKWLKIGDGATPWRELPWRLGPKGETGLKGDQGERGPKGDTGDRGEPGKDAFCDQTYNPKSENAQSGIAVAEALASVSGGTEPLKLIKTISLEEDVSDINVTFDIGLKEIVVIMNVAFDEAAAKAICCRSDGGSWYMFYNSINLTTNNRYFYARAKEVGERLWETIMFGTSVPNLNGTNSTSVKISVEKRAQTISRYVKNLNFFTAGRTSKFVVGSTIEIWGVEE